MKHTPHHCWWLWVIKCWNICNAWLDGNWVVDYNWIHAFKRNVTGRVLHEPESFWCSTIWCIVDTKRPVPILDYSLHRVSFTQKPLFKVWKVFTNYIYGVDLNWLADKRRKSCCVLHNEGKRTIAVHQHKRRIPLGLSFPAREILRWIAKFILAHTVTLLFSIRPK
jgi:hypothetical protein